MIKKIFKTLIIILLSLFFIPLIISPVYNFPIPQTFKGEKLYNPYLMMNPNIWKKGNFQVQLRAWGGLTDGRTNTFDKVWNTYNDLGYDIIGISDYQKINYSAEDSTGFIPIYEHGYNIAKTHQVSIGAKKVLWLDFPLLQTLNQKQFLINLQRNNTEILALVHPAFSFEGYNHKDLSMLTNYDLIEALNMQILSLSNWDAALSSGHAAFILADDDVHNIEDPLWYGRIATIINSKTVNRKDILNALKTGNSYGITLLTPDNDSQKAKVERVKNIPFLRKVILNSNQIFVKADSGVKEIKFIGQNGITLKTIVNCDSAFYTIKPTDTYVRIEIDYGRGQKMFLNPIFRYSGNDPFKQKIATINWLKTISFNTLFLILFILILLIINKLWK